MATISKTRTAAATLSGTAADTVNLGQPWDRIEVVNATAAPLYVRFDGTVSVAAADGTALIPASSSKTFTPPVDPGYVAGSAPAHILSLVGADNAYTVTGYAGY